MAMSDCLHCWNTPCVCGWDYRNYSIKYLEEQKILIDIAIQFKEINPNAKHNWDGKTKDDVAYLNFIREKRKE